MNGFAILLLLAAAPPAPVDFDTEVLPVLAKAGCNAGACHGAAAGRGGFKLSLFGGDPAADHRQIVRELQGRRVNLAHPERSLLLLKPTWQLEHEGGQRFEADCDFAALLERWIAGGAPRQPARQLVDLNVEPANSTLESLPAKLRLAVTARFDDGSVQKVEHLALYTPADPSGTNVDEQGNVEILRPGRHAIVVRFLTQVKAIQVTAAHPAEPLDLAALPRANWIDDEINATLAALRLPPAPPADDATLLRRVTLDLTGRLPAPDHVRAYLSDASPTKFDIEVERLLRSKEFTDHWTYRLSDWLRLEGGSNDPVGRQVYYAWLREQVEIQRPMHEWIAELLTAEGDSHAAGPPNFHRSAGDARGEAEHVAEALLAVRLRCANCHNHPLDRWTQDDYHGLAAIFAKLDRGQVIRVRSSGEVIHPATGESAVPRVPGERFLDPHADGREPLAAWLTSQDNRYFARAWANRFWESMFGRGLVHPADDLRDTNPATHPALLDRLAADFADNAYDLRRSLRLIAQSAAYQRAASPLAPRGSGAGGEGARSIPDNRFYSRAIVRPIPMPILVKLICQATDVAEDQGRKPADLISGNSQQMAMPRDASGFDPLNLAGCTGQSRSERTELPESLDQLTAQLAWLNGPLLNIKLAGRDNAFARLANSQATTNQWIEQFYLRTVSRLPSKKESAHWRQRLTESAWNESSEDFAWALLSCPEFVTNH